MSLLRRNRKGVGPLLKQTYRPQLRLCCPLSRGLGYVFACPTSKTSEAADPKLTRARSLDPLGRQTPRSSMIDFMKYEASGDYDTAARFLQLPPGENLANSPRNFGYCTRTSRAASTCSAMILTAQWRPGFRLARNVLVS